MCEYSTVQRILKQFNSTVDKKTKEAQAAQGTNSAYTSTKK